MDMSGTMCICQDHTSNMQFQEFFLEQDWVAAAVNILRSNSTQKIGLSGGSTPGLVYEAFAKSASPERAYTFVQIDERMVPPNHKDSNQKQIKAALGSFLHTSSFITVPTELSPASAACKYEEAIKNILPLDVAVLGIGPDGHTASLFPHSLALTSNALVTHTTTKQFAVENRISLTFLAIMQSKQLLVLLRGKEKYAIVQALQMKQKTTEEFPAIKLLEHPNVHVLHLNA